MSLNELRGTVQADELLFWGKITGINADYYIAVAVTYQGMYEFPLKSFYWTLSNTKDFKFREIPSLGLPEVQQDLFIDNCASYFLGEPAKLLNTKEGDAEAEAEAEPAKDEDEEGGDEKAKGQPKDSDESEEEEIKIPKRSLTEINRISAVVNAIENDCQLCPMSAFKMTQDHEMRRAEGFRGLSLHDSLNLQKYQHFRNAQSASRKHLLD